jgi:hypothetical protein
MFVTKAANKFKPVSNKNRSPRFGGTLSQNRTDRLIPKSRIEKNEDEVFAPLLRRRRLISPLLAAPYPKQAMKIDP